MVSSVVWRTERGTEAPRENTPLNYKYGAASLLPSMLSVTYWSFLATYALAFPGGKISPTKFKSQPFKEAKRIILNHHTGSDLQLINDLVNDYIIPQSQNLLRAAYTIDNHQHYQVYKCNSGQYVLDRAQALLEGSIDHFFLDGVPAWKVGKSRIFATDKTVVSSRPGNDTTIPWLVVKTSHVEQNPLVTVKTIIRSATSGGGLNQKCRTGDLKRVPYKALYTFYG